jgi:tellurium resistance protein TerD
MPLSLSKGGNVSLSKVAEEAKQPLEKVIVGLGWDARMTDGSAFDLDASAFMLAENGQVRSNDDFIFYNQLQSKDGSVVHSGDNLTGIGEGDDEQVTLDLTKVPADVTRIPFCVTIHEADSRKQNFGMVSSAYIRIINTSNSEEMVRYDLSEDASTETAMIFGELYRHGSEWKFKAIEQGSAGGLGPLAQNYGVNLG